MSITVSEATEKGIIRNYPHLTKEEVTWMFKRGELIPVPIEDIYVSDWLFERLSVYKLQIPFSLAEILNVDCLIDLETGEDGIICTKRIDEHPPGQKF
ncbi:hypothetical protein [Bacillus weihaiensis]|uniref:hypothetical protein n=1 Tax=Bacillus weihaiensis TaxID=1547283 RepID=UPI002356D8D5|nr:hypothetical protein [Bacillus weihaiensis]